MKGFWDIVWGFILGMGLISVFVFAEAKATEVNSLTSFAPPNNLRIFPSSNVDADNLSRASFDKAIDLVYNHYSPILAKSGWRLQFNRLWSDPTVNSDTYQQGRTIIINSYGGLARHPKMKTIATYAQVACHELGHSLGGTPYYSGQNMSVEGQADRYATKNCMKAIGFSMSQITQASLGLAAVLADLEGVPAPAYPGPKLRPYPGIEQDHPPAQCRLDEYIGAAQGEARNKCWYNP
jgi:hypothetical protein